MSKQLIRLTESDLHRIVKESVRRTILETIRGGKIRLNECGGSGGGSCGGSCGGSGGYHGGC